MNHTHSKIPWKSFLIVVYHMLSNHLTDNKWFWTFGLLHNAVIHKMIKLAIKKKIATWQNTNAWYTLEKAKINSFSNMYNMLPNHQTDRQKVILDLLTMAAAQDSNTQKWWMICIHKCNLIKHKWILYNLVNLLKGAFLWYKICCQNFRQTKNDSAPSKQLHNAVMIHKNDGWSFFHK